MRPVRLAGAAATAAACLALAACASAGGTEPLPGPTASSTAASPRGTSSPTSSPEPASTASPPPTATPGTTSVATDVPLDEPPYPDTPVPTALPTGPVDGEVSDSVSGDGAAPAPPPGAAPPAPGDAVAPAPPPGAVQLVFTGEVLMHRSLIDTALETGRGRTYDFRPMFSEIKSIIAPADLAVCHLELPYIPDGEGMNPRFAAPKQVADALRYAGFDRCSTASNHIFDRGAKGIDATLAGFRRTGMTQAGIASSVAGQRPAVLTIKGMRITHLSYTRVAGKAVPATQPYRVAMATKPRILADVRAARAKGAEYVIVSIHDSDELAYRPTADQISWDRWLTGTAGVDLVVGTGSHVPEAAVRSGGKYVLYGLGNLINWRINARDSVIARVYLVRGADGKVKAARAPELIPTFTVEKLGYRILDARTTSQNKRDPEVRALLRQSLTRVSPYIGGSIPTD
ncbi:MAG: CapA family protein [Candidatus Nanopelagicales bacterium]